MAEQARKFGARIAELRHEKGWLGRELVARMAELGDDALNTNQLSRYENGGAFPNEQRRERFATALDTTEGDLYAGPMAERPATGESPDPFSAPPSQAQLNGRLEWIETALQALLSDRGLELDAPPSERAHRPRNGSSGAGSHNG